MEGDNLVLTTDSCLNPAASLSKEEGENQKVKHNCLNIIKYQTKVCPDLKDSPLSVSSHLFIYGSSRVVNSNNKEMDRVCKCRETNQRVLIAK